MLGMPKTATRWLRPLFVVATWVGLLFLPQDLADLPAALQGWGAVMEILTRDTALIIFSGALVYWVLIRDIVPAMRRSIARRPFEIAQHIHTETYGVVDESGGSPGLFATYYYLVVGNGQSSGQTIRNVQAHIFFINPPLRTLVRSSDKFTTDLQHGTYAYFRIGRIISSEMREPGFDGHSTMTKEQIERYSRNAKSGHICFDLFEDKGIETRHALGFLTKSKPFPLSVIVSGDNVPAELVRLTVDMSKPTNIVAHGVPES